jgi:uncharacterized sporulation protein YeaH/YhbH (DUF444 family)
MEFIKASENKQRSIQRQKQMLEELRNYINKAIQDAVNEGQFKTVWYDHVDAATISKLELAGYSCNQITTEQGVGWLISWQ